MHALPARAATHLRTAARDLAYSPPARALARALENRPALRDALEERGHGEMVRRLASETLPAGQYYARLTIRNWKQHRGADFRLLERGEIVYGNRIQAPPEGTPLEYRNILVTSAGPADFTLDIPARFTLHLGKGAFATEEQAAFDRKYAVQRRDGLFSSVRGNTTTPTRLLVTFPGFPPANSRVSYAVSYLKALTEQDLAETLMVCFQDRYGVAGTYMVHDNAGHPLHERLTGALRSLMRRYGIREEDVLLFGASKGASIAVSAARDLPGARQVLVAPQMSLPYYFTKPVLRGGLLRDRALWEVEQPGTLLRRYLHEGRRIDYFYSDDDESSNCSLIEYVRDAEGLTKHRIGGAHAAVAKRSLPTVLSLLRGFATGSAGEAGAVGTRPAGGAGDDAGGGTGDGTVDGAGDGAGDGVGTPLVCTELTSTAQDESTSHRVQLGDDSLPEAANVYLEGWLGRTRFRQLLSSGQDPTARYTTTGQRTDPELHPAEFTHVTAFDGTPHVRTAPIPRGHRPGDGAAPASTAPTPPGRTADAPPSADAARHPLKASTPLTCDVTVPREYALLATSGAPSARVRYVSETVDPRSDVAELYLVPQLGSATAPPMDREAASPATSTDAGGATSSSAATVSSVAALAADSPSPRVRFTMTALTGWRDLALIVRRLAVAAGVEQIRVHVTDPGVTTEQVRELEATTWPQLTVHDHRPA